ncbi:ATP-binding cassette sub- F member 3 [Cichlidogyrus casuarinus]|uniref:ATP-binding cassette sub- F member 3 n=1 Tax=Cichlidogyrus casuarinus TaxID=1844966 RepID=A0ABD2QKD3_9PLAT
MSTANIEAALAFIKKSCTNLDEVVNDYITDVLISSADSFANQEELHDTIGHFIIDADPSRTEEEVSKLCKDIFHLLRPEGEELTEHEALDAPIHMGSLMDSFNHRVIDSKSIWMAKKDVVSIVDQDKLKKAEAKIVDKQIKKSQVTNMPSNYSFNSLDEGANVSQQVDKRDLVCDENNEFRAVNELHIENFDISYGSRKILCSASLHVANGRRYGLVGRNGYGKTTLLKSISRRDLVIPRGVQVAHVEQEIKGDSTTALESVLKADIERDSLLAELRKLQLDLDDGKADARMSQIHHRLEEIEADKAPTRAALVLKGLGFDAQMQQRETRTFSGGWRMRLALAQALFSQPDLLLLDEPTNMLDMRAIVWLEDYLQTWKSILIVVSHDRAFLNNICTDMIHLTACKLDAYKGNYDAFETAREERLLNQRREYEAQKAERAHIQEFIDRFRYNAKRATLVQSRIKQLERMPPLVIPEKEVQVVLNLPECDKLGGTVLRLDEVCFHYSAEKPILQKVDLSVNSESRVVIVGENGAGKTTLLRILLGELDPVKGLRHAHRNLRIGYFSQHHVDQLELGSSSLEFLSRKYPNQGEAKYRSQLASFGIADLLAMQPIGSLSGGQKSRVAFAAMCLSSPNILILDEPTNHLDMETIAALIEALRKFQGAVILVSHDERLIDSLCTQVWVCTRYAAGSKLPRETGSEVRCLDGGLKEYRKIVRAQLTEELAPC